MGKLNYTNRKIEGLRLVQVVSKDLTKRIPPNAGYKSAFRDPGVELDLTGKALTDESFFEVASAMVESLAYQSAQGRCSRLEELSLKDNQLTIASLQALTPVVRLACRDLRDLDLSNNMIAVDTEDGVAIWESFLLSFEHCCALRRIDWSGNPLGTRAFEVLLRMYAKERPIDLKPLAEIEQAQDDTYEQCGNILRNPSHTPDFDEDSDREKMSHSHKRTGSRQDSLSPAKASAMAARADVLSLYATTQGLRSVPYLVLCDTSMTETCALHLSYIVENHHSTQQLVARVPAAKAGMSAQQLAAYDNDYPCRGIVYHPNSALATTGTRVLELAELRRDTQFGEGNGVILGSCLPESQDQDLPSRKSLDASSHATGFRRRQSNHKRFPGEESADLDRARTRIQGNTLHEAGVRSNELWSAALKMLVLGRDLQCPTKNRPPILAPSKPASETPKMAAEKGPIVKTLTIPGYVKPNIVKPLPPSRPTDCARPPTLLGDFPPLKPLTVKDPNQSINSRGLPSRKKSESTPQKLNTVNAMVWHETAEPVEGKRPLRIERVYRSELPCGFSSDAWRRILGYFADVNGILTADQQKSILRYAMDRKTLVNEREVLGLTVAAQIWRILDATGCLTYELDV